VRAAARKTVRLTSHAELWFTQSRWVHMLNYGLLRAVGFIDMYGWVYIITVITRTTFGSNNLD